MKLAITVCATAAYTYAMIEQAIRVQANVQKIAKRITQLVIVIVGDDSGECKSIVEFYRTRLFLTPDLGFKVFVAFHVLDGVQDRLENYKQPAQILIARMRSAAFTIARGHNADFCWSLDSDVLPPANALLCSMDMLNFDNGFYGVATCPYPSQGGGDWLSGRGTPQRNILPDWTDEERMLPKRLQMSLKARRNALDKAAKKKDQAAQMRHAKKLHLLERRAEKFPPAQNVFAANAKSYRRRGWFSQAYPGIGKGSVVPTDWCGFGCTLMNKTALELATFDGYSGGGTEDLFIVWQRWFPAGVRIAAIPHCPCDHVIRERTPDGKQDLTKFAHVQSYHAEDGECVGHLRQRRVPFVPLPF